MKYCAKHDITYPDGGTCWCCDVAKKTASLDEQESTAQSALEAAQKQLDAAKKEADETEIRIQATLDQRVVDAQAALEKATQERNAHRAKMPLVGSAPVALAPAQVG